MSGKTAVTEAEVIAILNLLPDHSFLRHWVFHAATHTEAHASFHLLAGLVALAATAPIELGFYFSGDIYANLYTLVIGTSGRGRKSTTVTFASKAIEAVVPSSYGQRPGSHEALVDSLKTQSRQVIPYPEFGNFLSAAKGNVNLATLKTTYTEAWDSTPLSRSLVRRQGSEASAPTPRLSMAGACTMEFLEDFTNQTDWLGGFMSRFLCLIGDPERKMTRAPGKKIHWGPTYGLLSTLANTPWAVGECVDFSPEGAKLWDDWNETIPTRVPRLVDGAIARAPTQALKIALLLGWDLGTARQDGRPWYLTPLELVPALKIADLHIKSVLRIGERIAPNNDMKDRRAILDAIEDGPQTLGEIIGRVGRLKDRVVKLVDSMCEEKIIASTPIGGQHKFALWRYVEDQPAVLGAVIPLYPVANTSYEVGGSNPSGVSQSAPSTSSSDAFNTSGPPGDGATWSDPEDGDT